MRVTQGTFSFLPELTDEQIDAQIRYALRHGWALSIEYTDDPHPRNSYWELWGLPVFDVKEEDSETILREVRAAAKRSRELDMALSTWGDVTFDFESTDTPDVTVVPTLEGAV